MSLLDIPNTWPIQEIMQIAAEHEEEQNHQYYVSEDFANVYLEPACTSEIVECLSYGTVINEIEDDGLWIRINLRHSSNEVVGWIQKSKIEKYYTEDD